MDTLKNVDIKSLALNENDKKEMLKSLVGQRFDRSEITEHINNNSNLSQNFKEELMIWTEQWWL